MGVFDDYEPEFSGGMAAFVEGWQTVRVMEIKEDSTQSGNARLTLVLEARDANGEIVMNTVNYDIVMGNSYSNRNLTQTMLCFGLNPEDPEDRHPAKFRGRQGDVYLCKQPSFKDPSKLYWGVRNMRYAYKGKVVETWYRETPKKAELPPDRPDFPKESGDGFVDDTFSDVPF